MSLDEKHVEAELSTPERPDLSATEDDDDTDDGLDSAPVASQPTEKQPRDEAPTTPPKRRPTPPPRRELPFAAPARQKATNEAMGTKTGSQTADNTSATVDGDDDETSDDEL